MDVLAGQTLTNKKSHQIKAEVALADIQVICYYFSAHWCPPCRGFTPVLADFYNELKEAGAAIEVVFVSSDRSDADMKSYMQESHGDWLAATWGSPLVSTLKTKYGISGIPSLIVVRQDGTLITKDGRSDVHRKGAACFQEWTK